MIRIAGGQARGRKLLVPQGSKTRPTSSMVREAVFGMIQLQVPGANVLDLFCGSGAYALEALSRGAECAVLIDSDSKSIQTARSNIQTLGYQDKAEVFLNDYAKALQILVKNDRKFDIIFLDPPYASGFYTKAIECSEHVLTEGGCIICEHPSSLAIEPTDALSVSRQKRYGIRSVTILIRRNNIDGDLSGQL